MPTLDWATMRCSRAPSEGPSSSPSRSIGARRSAGSRAIPARAWRRRSCSCAQGELLEREPLVFDAGPDLVRRLAIVSGGGLGLSRGGGPRGRGCLPDGRARRACHGRSPRGADPLHRSGPLRDRAARREGASASTWRRPSGCVTSSSTYRTRSSIWDRVAAGLGSPACATGAPTATPGPQPC